MAALCSFRLLFRRRFSLTLFYPETVLAFEQSSLCLDGGAFPCRLNSPKPGLPWGARSNFRLAYFGRGSGAGWLCRHKFVAWIRAFSSNAEIRTLAAVILLTITFHGVVPIQQGLEWYYGKGYDDQLNYVLLAEFLKEEPYSTSPQDIGLRPWLVRPIGFRISENSLERVRDRE